MRSSWRKAGILAFDPDLVLGKVKPREQRQPAPGGRGRGPSSSPPACWDSPSGMRKLRAIISQTVDKKTKKIIKRLSDDLHSSQAELALERLAKQKTKEALRHQKKKVQRGKMLMEQFRAQEGSGAILFSPGKVRAALELQEHRVREREQEKADKQMRAEERALAKIERQKGLSRDVMIELQPKLLVMRPRSCGMLKRPPIKMLERRADTLSWSRR